MVKQKSLLPVLALVVANIIWGLNPPLIKLGVETIPPVIFLSLRFMVAALVLLPFAIKTWKPLKAKDMYLLVLSSVIFISLGALALNLGLARTSSINAGVLGLLAPLLLFVLSVEFLKERISVKTLVGVLLAFVGSLIIIGRPWESAGASLTGDLLIIIFVLCDIIATLIFKSLSGKTSAYQTTFACFFFGALPATVYSLTQLGSWDIGATTAASVYGLVGSLIVILLANPLFFYGLKYKKAQSVGIYGYLIPITTIVAAYFILSERPSMRFAIGAAMVFLGVYLAEFARSKKLRLPGYLSCRQSR